MYTLPLLITAQTVAVVTQMNDERPPYLGMVVLHNGNTWIVTCVKYYLYKMLETVKV